MRTALTVCAALAMSTCARHDNSAPRGSERAATYADTVRCASLRPTDSLSTTRAGFLQEVLDARATSRTPRFDDYHDGSYHVDKRDLASGLIELSRACALPLEGAVLLGPVGPLWAYHVVVILNGSDGMSRVNSLVMPHARITGKATGIVLRRDVDLLFESLAKSTVLEQGKSPRALTNDTTTVGRDFAYEFLAFHLVGDSTAYWSASLGEVADTTAATKMLAPVNAILNRLAPTYPDGATRRRRDHDTYER